MCFLTLRTRSNFSLHYLRALSSFVSFAIHGIAEISGREKKGVHVVCVVLVGSSPFQDLLENNSEAQSGNKTPFQTHANIFSNNEFFFGHVLDHLFVFLSSSIFALARLTLFIAVGDSEIDFQPDALWSFCSFKAG